MNMNTHQHQHQLMPMTLNPEKHSAIFADTRNLNTTTDKYDHISTLEVLTICQDHGWIPVAANQSKTRKATRQGFQKHAIKLMHPTISNALPNLATPSLLLRHSHDGASSLQLLLSLHVFLCSNGLVRHSGDMGEIRVLHRNYNPTLLEEALKTFISSVHTTVTEVDTFQSITLDTQEQKLLAQSAIEMRFEPTVLDEEEHAKDNSKGIWYPVTPELALTKRRTKDETQTLWGTFSVLQENLVDKGGLRTLPNPTNLRNQNLKPWERPRRTRIRAIKSLDANVSLNRHLWALTKRMADLKEGRAVTQ